MDAGRTALDHLIPGSGALAKAFTNFFGWGAYKGSKNTLLQASPVPLMHAQVDKGVRIVHKEFLGNLSSSVAFQNTIYDINPGIHASFPWLSGIASSFSKYKINGLIFYFKSTAANMVFNTDNALGCVVGTVNYNVYDSSPNSLEQALNMAGAMEEKPTKDCIFPVECDKFHAVYPTYYVRTRTRSDDKTKYDCGKFNLSTFGSQAPAVVGQLWVAYDFTLMQPLPSALSIYSTPIGEYYFSMAGSATVADPIPGAVLENNTVYPTTDNPTVLGSVIEIPPQSGPCQLAVTLDYNFTDETKCAIGSPSISNLTAIGSGMYLTEVSGGNHMQLEKWYDVVDPSLPSNIDFKITTVADNPLLVAGLHTNFIRVDVRPGGIVSLNKKKPLSITVEEPEDDWKQAVPTAPSVKLASPLKGVCLRASPPCKPG